MIKKLRTPKDWLPSVNSDKEIREKINELVDAVNELQKQVKKIDQNFNVEQPKLKEISNTEYVTITADNVYVGGKPATKYNGQDIYRPYICVAQFKETRDIVREEYGFDLLELHCLQSSTKGERVKTGNPVPDKNGIYSWVRAVYKDKEGKVVASLWVFLYDHSLTSLCASNCADGCSYAARNGAAWRVGLFGNKE